MLLAYIDAADQDNVSRQWNLSIHKYLGSRLKLF
jgi:hypothetical protein